MDSRLLGRRLAAISGVSAIIAMGAITAACAKEEKAPETTTRRPPPRHNARHDRGRCTAGTDREEHQPHGRKPVHSAVQATPAPNVPPGQHPGINGDSLSRFGIPVASHRR